MALFSCEECGTMTANVENDYGEHVCDNCEQNAAERAWERHCEDFHDGGSTRFVSLLDQQVAAMRIKNGGFA